MAEYFKHPQALVESEKIGKGTRVWAFAHVLPGAKIGSECNICDGVFIENEVVVGDRVTIKCGVQLWDGVTIEDDVFVGPNVTFTNDRFPRSKQHPAEYAKTLVKKGASIGANATILPNLVVGEHAMVGAGAVVTRNVPRYAIVVGNPARITGYCDAAKVTPAKVVGSAGAGERRDVPRFERVTAVKAYPMPVITDLRGSITVGEIGKNMPFNPKRYFVVFDVPGEEVRGEHAHRTCHQFLVCLRGRVTVMVDDGESREEIVLDSPRVGVHLPPMVWGVQYKYSRDAALLVLASEAYDAADYIRDYGEFMSMLKTRGSRA